MWELFHVAASLMTDPKTKAERYSFFPEQLRLAFDIYFDPDRHELFRLLRGLKARMNKDVPWDS